MENNNFLFFPFEFGVTWASVRFDQKEEKKKKKHPPQNANCIQHKTSLHICAVTWFAQLVRSTWLGRYNNKQSVQTSAAISGHN